MKRRVAAQKRTDMERLKNDPAYQQERLKIGARVLGRFLSS